MTEFAIQRNRKDGRQTRCKACNKAYREANKERVNAAIDRWHKDVGWEHRLTKLYRVPKGWYAATLATQGGVCAICGTPPPEGRRLYVDHDHTCCPTLQKSTDRTCGNCVRGLLCSPCNVSLGHLERPEWREKAERYLSK
jgi:hypothetical protein